MRIAAATVLAALIGIFFYAAAGDIAPLSINVIAIAYCTVRLLYFTFRKRNHEMMLMLHFFVLFGNLAPLFVQYTNNRFGYDWVTVDGFNFHYPILISLVGLISIDVGYTIVGFFRSSPAEPVPRHRPNSAYLTWVLVVSGIVCLAAVSTIGLSFYRVDRLAQHFDFQFSAVKIAFGIFFVRQILYFSFIILLAALVARATQFNERWLALAGCFTIGIAILIFSSPVGTPRMVLFGFLLMIYATVPGLKSAVSRMFLIVGGFFGLFILFPLVGSASREYVLRFNLSFQEIVNYMTHLDFDNGMQSVLGYQFISDTGFQNGTNILSALFSMVPRSIWTDKSEGLGAAIVTHFEVKFTNVSSPIFTEFYADFGMPGVVIFSALFGGLLAIIYSKARKGEGLHFWRMIELSFFVSMPIIVRGSLVTAAVGLYSFTACAIIFMILRRISAVKPKKTDQSLPNLTPAIP